MTDNALEGLTDKCFTSEDSSIVLLAAQLYKLGVLQKLCVSCISGRLCGFCLLRAHGIRARQLRAQVKKCSLDYGEHLCKVTDI